MRLLYVAVVLSGAAGLLYQVAWTRRLASVTSATVAAQAIVLAIFMAGLGLGSYVGGRMARRIRRPALAYALVECGALALALISVPVIAASDEIRTLLARAGVPLASGLWIQLFAVSAFLVVPTGLLGASLPFVIEHAERLRARRPAAVGFLYGFNTLGAAAGCLIAGFWAVETLGLTATTWVGAGFALGAALLAGIENGRVEHDPRIAGARGPTARPSALPGGLLLAAGVGGFVGLGSEVIWTRLVMLLVDNTVYAFSQVLASVLLGIALGGHGAGYVIQRAARRDDPGEALLDAAGNVVLLAAILLAAVPAILVALSGAPALRTGFSSGGSPLAALLLLGGLVPPAALVAMTLPLLACAARSVGTASAFGTLYAANTLGSVAGSLAAGFVLLPVLGMDGANTVMVVTACGLAVLLYAGGRRMGGRRPAVAGAAAACLLLDVSYSLPEDVFAPRLPADLEVLEFREGTEALVMVTESANHTRRLWINSKWVAGAGPGHPPGHEVLGHLPPLLLEHPRRALGIALGTGQTFASALDHGFELVDCVEINDGVIELSSRWFGAANRGFLDDPRVVVHNDDGRAFLRATRDSYDLVVLEPLQAWQAGTSNLYAREFYQEASRVLGPGGILAQWIPFYGQGLSETRSMVATVLAVFPHGSLWVNGVDGFLLAGDREIDVSPAVLEERIRSRHLQPRLDSVNLNGVGDVLSQLWVETDGLRAWAGGAAIITDDHPFLEFRAPRSETPDTGIRIVASLGPHLSPLDGGSERSARSAAVLEEARTIRSAFRDAELLPTSTEERAAVLEVARARAPGSGRLRSSYRDFVLRWSRELRGDPEAQIAVLRRALEHDPEFGEAIVRLAVLELRLGRIPAARELLAQAYAMEGLRSRVEKIRNTHRSALQAP